MLLSGKNVILSVPTGAGKTWASVMPFLFATQNQINSFPQKTIYSLPLRTLTNSIYSDIKDIINNDKINPLDVHEKQLCQVLCAYRIFLPYVGITVSSRESAEFRNGIVKIAATKVSAGVSTGIGDHESKYTGKETDDVQGDEQFEIDDNRSLDKMYKDIAEEGLQPVLNDYLYV